MGVQDGTKFLRPGKGLTHTLKSIRNSVRNSYPLDGDKHPLVLVDTSIFLVAALRRKETLCQYFALPPVPVTAVADAVEQTCNLLVQNKFCPCLVLDGASYPPKADTSRKRYSSLPDDIQKLEDLYASEDATRDAIFEQQKKAISVRPDLLYEVVRMAESKSYDIIGAPFEADSQIVSLLKQGIGEFAITNDSDIPYQGAVGTIMQLSQQGKCFLVRQTNMLTSLKNRFRSERDITIRDLAIFAAMCGTDYVARASGYGAAYAESQLKVYVTLHTEPETNNFINEHLKKLPDGERRKFDVSLYSWEHAPAFIVVPKDDRTTPMEAFESGQFGVRLGPMSNLVIKRPRWEEGLGFPVLEKLRAKHPAGRIPATFYDMFKLNVWSRTGEPLPQVPPLRDEAGHKLLPYAIINFKLRPARLLDPTVLRTYLVARGINRQFEDHEQLLAKVQEVALDPNPPLPRFLFRGHGGYQSYEVFAPRSEQDGVTWVRGDDVLQKIRNVVPTISDDWFTRLFGIRNASRLRCLKHLKGGSYNLTDLEYTDELKNQTNPNSEIVVFRASCAPSQKLGGGDLYSLTCVFEKCPSGQYEYVDHPLSQCDCYNGHTLDAHKGGLLLLMFVIQQRQDWDFQKCISMFPESIHSVVSYPIFVSYVYPRLTSPEAKVDTTIRKTVLAAAKLSAAADDSDSDSASDSPNENDGSDNHIESDTIGGEVEGDDASLASYDSPQEIHWANPLMTNPVRDVASAPTLPVCEILQEWLAELEACMLILGDPRKLASRLLQQECEERARVNTDLADIKLQLTRFLELRGMVEKDPGERRCLLSHAIEENIKKVEDSLRGMHDVDVMYSPPDIYVHYKY